MYRFQKDFNIDEIIGESISQWSLCRNSISFNIAGVSFMVESMISIEENNIIKAQWWGNQSFDLKFFDALDSNILEYEIPQDDTLLIKLENGLTIRIMDNSDQYESIQINLKDGKYYII